MKTPQRKPSARKSPRVMACSMRREPASRAAKEPRLPKATLDAMRETEEILAHPEKHPGMTFAEYVAWAHAK